jgi:hypothetical protein
MEEKDIGPDQIHGLYNDFRLLAQNCNRSILNKYVVFSSGFFYMLLADDGFDLSQT